MNNFDFDIGRHLEENAPALVGGALAGGAAVKMLADTVLSDKLSTDKFAKKAGAITLGALAGAVLLDAAYELGKPYTHKGISLSNFIDDVLDSFK